MELISHGKKLKISVRCERGLAQRVQRHDVTGYNVMTSAHGTVTVSYTHLTLPTIYSV